MKKCLIIINQSAGKAKKCTPQHVRETLGKQYEYETIFLPSQQEPTNFDGYDAVAVCGGDGTLSSAISKAQNSDVVVYYFAYGTVNDKAKVGNFAHHTDTTATPLVVGKANQQLFTYVFACGAFTPIGYLASVKQKQRFGVFAYLTKIFKAYKVWRINGTLTLTDEKGAERQEKGQFNLIMFIKSSRCFGFNFNKDYDEQANFGHLVAIRSPKHDGLLGKIEMFFPFFRVFFVGLRKPCTTKNIIFARVSKANVQLRNGIVFDKDGEHCDMPANVDVTFCKTTCKLMVKKK